ncbi:MAG: CAP domain-containing protein, partial [Planctomycetia bacterium]|nr:CAP domain-containing protein [Planctomycetia bacterium]
MKYVHSKNMKARLLRVESLETRDLLAATGVNASGASDPGCWYDLSALTVSPSPKEQEMLELINRMRSDPAGELSRLVPVCNPEAEGGPWLTEGSSTIWNDEFFTAFAPEITQNCQDRYPAVDADTLRSFLSQWRQLSSAAPLAFNSTLSSVASTFTTYLIDHPNEYLGNFAHNENLEQDLGGQFYTYGENVYACDQTIFNGFSAMQFFHAAFAIDWGNSGAEHRANIMNGNFSELGISVQNSINEGTYSVIDFGTSTTGARTDGAYLLGVVYNDADGDGIYDAPEGINNVRLLIRNLDLDTENTVEITNMSAGGYQIFLQNGHYSITATGVGSAYPGAVTKLVSINGANKKVDFLTSDYTTGVPQVDLGGGVSYDFGVVVTYTEKADAISPVTGIKISDSDSAFLSKAVVSLGNRPNGDAENIAFSATVPNGMSVMNNFKDGTLTLQGQASLSTYIDILKTLSWSFDYDKLSNGQTMSYEDRSINIAVFDGVNWSIERTATLKIDPADPLMSIASTKVYEGDNGTVYMEFEAVLDSPATTSCYCYVSPVAETDLSDEFTDDYFVEDRVKVEFNAGESRKTFSVAVLSNYAAQKDKATYESNSTYQLEDDLYFTLDVSDCNGLAWRGGEVRGTIIDDDTPSLIIADSHWDFVPQLNFQTEYGTQRFMYAVTAAESGLMTWSADSNVPAGFTISVYDSVYSETQLAAVTLETTATGQKAQWAVS